ncbi:MAG: acyl carrier protein [Eubacterium sp.]|nr:acyl carrier protein [Eubacterium sp.]
MQDVIIDVIKEICLIESDEPIFDKYLRADLMISSLDYVKLVTLVEDELDVELPDDILVVEEDFRVKDFIDRVKAELGDC